MVGDGLVAKSTRGIPSLGIHNYCRDNGTAYDERRVGVAHGDSGDGNRRSWYNQVIYIM